MVALSSNPYLHDITELPRSLPVIVVKFVPMEVSFSISCNVVNGGLILQGKLKHIIGGVPPCFHITGHYSFSELQLVEIRIPNWLNQRSRVNDLVCKLAKL
jgi:hypothetical protein